MSLPDIGKLSLNPGKRKFHEEPFHEENTSKRAFKESTSPRRNLLSLIKLFNQQYSFEIRLRPSQEYCTLLATPSDTPYIIFELNAQQQLEKAYFYLPGRIHLIASHLPGFLVYPKSLAKIITKEELIQSFSYIIRSFDCSFHQAVITCSCEWLFHGLNFKTIKQCYLWIQCDVPVVGFTYHKKKYQFELEANSTSKINKLTRGALIYHVYLEGVSQEDLQQLKIPTSWFFLHHQNKLKLFGNTPGFLSTIQKWRSKLALTETLKDPLEDFFKGLNLS